MLTYKPNSSKNIQNKRKRNIIWFNPPYGKNIIIKVAAYFLNLLQKHFPQHHKFRKQFNKNNVKVSYSCMPNMKSIINAQNKNTIGKTSDANPRTCNCIYPNDCPLNGNCLAKESLYEGKITSDLPNNKDKFYKGISEHPFKLRYGNHKKSFNHEIYKNDSELSKEYWEVRKKGGNPKVMWKILKKCSAYNLESKKCLLCISEKLEIAEHNRDNILNKRSDVVSKYRHKNKYELAKLDSND